MNVRAMTDKAIDRSMSTLSLARLGDHKDAFGASPTWDIADEFHRRRAKYKRNLRRYQKRFKQGVYAK